MIRIYVGPPCSGKSTAMLHDADDLRGRGYAVLTVDFDALCVALGSAGEDGQGHGHGEHVVPIAQYARGIIIRQSVEAAAKNPGMAALIVDSSPNERRRALYERHGATIRRMDLEVTAAECHRRADAAGRPSDWHRLIDEWAPEAENSGWADTVRKPWRRTPGYRKHAKGSTYERLRRVFLAGKTNCECGCGQPFVVDAPCTHPRCLKRGTGCMFHPQYPTVQHTQHLIDGGPSLDVSTWQAWASACNTGDGARVGNARRGRRQAQGDAETRAYTNLDW